MWLVWEDKLHGWVWCAIRVRVCEGEVVWEGGLRWEGAFKGSRSVSEQLLGCWWYVGSSEGGRGP